MYPLSASSPYWATHSCHHPQRCCSTCSVKRRPFLFLMPSANLLLPLSWSYWMLSSHSYGLWQILVAICQLPVLTLLRMTPALCVKIAVGCWLGGLAGPVAEISWSLTPFCGPNRIQHIFCDFPCSELGLYWHINQCPSGLCYQFCKILATFLLTSSYVQIICTVLSIPSVAGKRKAFTCASHLTVVLIFYGSILFMYVLLKKSLPLTMTGPWLWSTSCSHPPQPLYL